MSFEETLVCDGCSSVLSGGPRRETVPELLASGGRAFAIADRRRKVYVRVFGQEASTTSCRHLCVSCAGADAFFDGIAVPT